MRNITIYAVVSYSLFLACWGKQEHDIVRPEIPHYVLSGTARDMDGKQQLDGIVIEIAAARLLYDVDFETRTLTTDSTGQFELDPVYPGSYVIRYRREGFWIGGNGFNVEHCDKVLALEIPKIFHAHRFPAIWGTGRPTEKFHGPSSIDPAFACKGSKGIIKISGNRFDVLKRSQGQWFYQTTREPELSGRKTFGGMTCGRESIYALVSSIYLYIFSSDFSSSTIVEPETPGNGLACDTGGNALYICSGNCIHRYDGQINRLNSFTFPFEKLKALAFSENLYSYDLSENLLRIHDPENELIVLATYALIDAETGHQISRVFDMDFDGYGRLWVTGS